MSESDNSAPDDNVMPIDRARAAVKETVDRTRDVLGTARERARDVAGDMGGRLGDVSASARRYGDRVRDQYGDRAEQLRHGYDRVQDNFGHYSDDLNDFVHQNPGRAVLLAAGAGFVLGLLMRGRR